MLASPITVIVPNAIVPSTEDNVKFAFPVVVTVPTAVDSKPNDDKVTSALPTILGELNANVAIILGNVTSALPTTVTVPIEDVNGVRKLAPINIPLSIENIEGRTVSLTGINIDAYGNIETTYGLNNIVKRGQIALAKFNNDTELKSVGANAFNATNKSGELILGSALSGSLGEIISGALESSNTNITNEMVSMMKTQQAFNGNARIMQASVDISRRLMDS